jgi:hypothetical protein
MRLPHVAARSTRASTVNPLVVAATACRVGDLSTDVSAAHYHGLLWLLLAGIADALSATQVDCPRSALADAGFDLHLLERAAGHQDPAVTTLSSPGSPGRARCRGGLFTLVSPIWAGALPQ